MILKSIPSFYTFQIHYSFVSHDHNSISVNVIYTCIKHNYVYIQLYIENYAIKQFEDIDASL